MSEPNFQFVTVHAGKSTKSSKTWVEADERRKVRVAVMRDHVRQKQDHKRTFSPAAMSLDMKSHMARFRPMSKTRRTRATPSHITDKTGPTTQLIAFRESSRHDEDVKHEGRILRIRGLDGVDPFSIVPVDISDPETMSLMEYYFKSYWSNSLAVNPNGGWTLVALRDRAIIHAKMSLVAVHKADKTGEVLPSAYLKHRGYALRLIAERLAEGGDDFSDEIIGAVAILSSSDCHSHWSDEVLDSHARGIAVLVANRGGIDAPALHRNVARVVAWTDLLHSALREQPIMLGRSRHAREVDLAEFGNIAGKTYATKTEQRKATQHLPSPVRNIIRQLRILSDIRTILSTRRIPRLREMFSCMVWKLEYDILELQDEDRSLKSAEWCDHSIFDTPIAFLVLRDASLIYSYSAFRDQNSTSSYRRISRRLEQYLFELVSHLQTPHSPSNTLGETPDYSFNVASLSAGELVLLLWFAYTGWKGARLAHERSSTLWFSSLAAQICRVLIVDDGVSARIQLKGIVWNDENDVGLLPIFWEDLKSHRHTGP